MAIVIASVAQASIISPPAARFHDGSVTIESAAMVIRQALPEVGKSNRSKKLRR
jgi:hypothetical protein